MGALLVLCERLAREHGNGPMVTLEDSQDGTGRARFTVSLDRDEPFLEN